MIFDITDGITSLSAERHHILARALAVAVENIHFLNVSFKALRWIEQEIIASPDFYGDIQREALREIIAQTPSSILSKNLAHFQVGGNADGDVVKMLVLATEPSHIIVENSKNDGAVIAKWVRLYKDERAFKSLNELVAERLKRNRIRFANAGGKGNIPNEADSLMPLFKNLHSYKLLAIFDSDKGHAADTDKNHHIKQELDNRAIAWHELSNRAVENYFPFSTYSNAQLVRPGIVAPSIGETDEWDYCHLNSLADLAFAKDDLIALARELTKDELKSRMAHKQANPDEIQAVILKIAKIA